MTFTVSCNELKVWKWRTVQAGVMVRFDRCRVGDTCKCGLHWYEWGPLTVKGFSYMVCVGVLVAPSADSFWSPGHRRFVATWPPLQSHVPWHYFINRDSIRSDERFSSSSILYSYSPSIITCFFLFIKFVKFWYPLLFFRQRLGKKI